MTQDVLGHETVILSNRNGTGNIGLAGVEARFRGKGLGNVLMQAAISWFASKGVSRVTVYDHFKDKAGLLEALAWWTVARLDIDRVRRARPCGRQDQKDSASSPRLHHSSFSPHPRPSPRDREKR